MRDAATRNDLSYSRDYVRELVREENRLRELLAEARAVLVYFAEDCAKVIYRTTGERKAHAD